MRVELNAYLNIVVNMLGFIQASMASVVLRLEGLDRSLELCALEHLLASHSRGRVRESTNWAEQPN